MAERMERMIAGSHLGSIVAVANNQKMSEGPRASAEAVASTARAKKLDTVVKNDSETESSKI